LWLIGSKRSASTVLSLKLINETEEFPQLKFPSLTTKTPLLKELGGSGGGVSFDSLMGFLLHENTVIRMARRRIPFRKFSGYVEIFIIVFFEL
jgi:hypothetical protein